MMTENSNDKVGNDPGLNLSIHNRFKHLGYGSAELAVLKSLVADCREFYSQKGYGAESAHDVSMLALRKYHSFLVRECEKSNSDFLKLPIEWQWEMSVDISEFDVQKVVRNFISEYRSKRFQKNKKTSKVGGR